VITTDVGLARRIVMDGLNGYVVPRDVGAFVHALWAMQRADLRRMAHHARIAAEAHAWRYKLPAWRAAIRAALEA
jgi:glycosyltransferase involved in cell wall biosynthesis